MTTRYCNLGGDAHISKTGNILRWKLGLHDDVKPRTPKTGVVVPVVHNDGRKLRRATQDSLTLIGHASFLVQLGGRSVLIDPIFSNSLGPGYPRNAPPGLSGSDLPPIDAVLITHNHRDHLDEATVRELGPSPLYVVPQGLGTWFQKRGLARVLEMQWWEQQEVAGIKVTFVPAQHWSRRGLFDANRSWWGGFVLEFDGLRFYHSGDTAWFDGFRLIGERVGPIQAAMLPIGAYAPRWFMKHQHMDPQDAVAAFQALGAEEFVAMHWGTFKVSDESLVEPPDFLRRVWEQTTLAEQRRRIPAIGETIIYR